VRRRDHRLLRDRILTLTPMMCARILKQKDEGIRDGCFSLGRIFNNVIASTAAPSSSCSSTRVTLLSRGDAAADHFFCTS